MRHWMMNWRIAQAVAGPGGLCGTCTGRFPAQQLATPGSPAPRPRAATPCPATGRLCPTPGLCSEPAGCVERRSMGMDFRHAEERVAAYMADGGTFEEAATVTLAQWISLRYPCVWDNLVNGKDVSK